jgi:enamine deaminase RidA (YjgF/YER057c/UK114 family)
MIAILVFAILSFVGAGMVHAADLQRWPLPGGPADSRVVRAGPIVHVPGVAPFGADGRIVSGDVKAQTRAVLDRVAEALKAAGTSLDRAASMHVYLRRAADFPAMNEVYATYWSASPPVRRSSRGCRIPTPWSR